MGALARLRFLTWQTLDHSLSAAFDANGPRDHSLHGCLPKCGEVPEWSNGAVSKTVVGASLPRVRIPVSPPVPCCETGMQPASGRETPSFRAILLGSTGPQRPASGG